MIVYIKRNEVATLWLKKLTRVSNCELERERGRGGEKEKERERNTKITLNI